MPTTTTSTKRPRRRALQLVEPVTPAEPEAPAQPEPAPESASPDQISVHITLAFQFDDAPAINAQFQVEMPRMPAEQNAMYLAMQLDARRLVQLLEPHLGPTSASAPARKPSAPARKRG